MNKRQMRHQAIRNLVNEQRIYTQQEMTQLLNDAGFNCTQATVSRDIVELGLEKSPSKFYVFAGETRLRRMITDMVKDVRAAGNLVVVKTTPGAASTVAEALDSSHVIEALGSVAGDDTILIVVETPEHALEVQKILDRFRA